MNISEERPAVKAILCERWRDGWTEAGGWGGGTEPWGLPGRAGRKAGLGLPQVVTAARGGARMNDWPSTHPPVHEWAWRQIKHLSHW